MLTGILLLLSCIGPNHGFNLDPSRAVIFNGPQGSYFGFSVSLHRNSKGDWLLVGAPKANPVYQESFNASGALFQCPLHQRPLCTQVKLDDKGNEEATKFIRQGSAKIRIRYTDRKDDQWLGVSIDSHQNADGGVVACAHRWADTRYRQHVFANGACYEMNGEMEFNSTMKRIALTKRSLQIRMVTPNEYLYAFGQQGLSSHYTEDGQKLVIGAPGIRDWTGGVVIYTPVASYVGTPERSTPINGYVGYAVSSGKFYDHENIYYVTGGPKIDMIGKVIVYKGGFDVRAELSGHQFGEYFGAALCVANLNHDGFDDLLVGAPHYKSKSYEEGRVAVYIMRHTHVFEHVMDLRGSEKTGARFGSAITTGDLNQDGHPDIIVGAPYEDDHGAIYIYNGHRHGLHTKFSQRIGATDIDIGLRGFGHALSKPEIREGQHYPDLPVGAYASNQAVLIPGRPVIALQMNAEAEPKLINPRVANCRYGKTSDQATCVAIGVVFKYTGERLPDGLSFRITLKSDITRRTGGEHELPVRASFKDKSDNGDLSPDISMVAQDWPAGQTWTNFTILVLKRQIRDIITPLSVSVSIELLSSKANASELAPILDMHRPSSMILPIPFDKYCGGDNHCASDLQLSASVLWPTSDTHIILGQKDFINLQLEVYNAGEKAYLSSLVVQYPAELQYIGMRKNSDDSSGNHISCTPHATEDYIEEHTHAELICEIGNPIQDNVLKTVTVAFNRPLKYHNDEFFKEEIVINVYTLTRSNETYLDNNNATVRLPVKISAEMSLSGVSDPEQQIYELRDPSQNMTSENGSSEEFSYGIAEVKHVYDLRNDGPGLFPGGFVEVLLPVSSKDGLILAETHIEITRESSKNDFIYAVDGREKRDVDDNDPTLGSSSDTESSDSPSAKPLFGRRKAGPLSVDCQTTNCQTHRYYIGHLNSGEGAVLTVRMWLAMDNLTSLESTGAVAYTSEIRLLGNIVDKESIVVKLKVKTLVTPRRVVMPDMRVPWWVLAASIGIGLFLLFVVIVVLYKFGFFTRTEREELAKLIGQNEENEENETRMMHASDNTADEWQSYDPWQPQTPETNLLIWHANGSISHSSREEYLAATHRHSGTSFDRNLNEKGRFSNHSDMNGGIGLHHSEMNGRARYPSDSLPQARDPRARHHGSTRSEGNRQLGSHFNRRSYHEDDFYRGERRPPSDCPSYLVLQPAEESDEEISPDSVFYNDTHIHR